MTSICTYTCIFITSSCIHFYDDLSFYTLFDDISTICNEICTVFDDISTICNESYTLFDDISTICNESYSFEFSHSFVLYSFDDVHNKCVHMYITV